MINLSLISFILDWSLKYYFWFLVRLKSYLFFEYLLDVNQQEIGLELNKIVWMLVYLFYDINMLKFIKSCICFYDI